MVSVSPGRILTNDRLEAGGWRHPYSPTACSLQPFVSFAVRYPYREIVSWYVPLPGHSVVVLWALCGSAVRLSTGTAVAVLRVLRALRGVTLLVGMTLLGTLLGRLLGHCLDVA